MTHFAGATAVGVAVDLDEATSARLDLSPVLRDRLSVSVLTGGITNRNYLVRTPHGDVVARVSSPDSSLLAIDREVEWRNSVAASAAGVGAPVLDYVRGEGLLVVGYLPGRTFTQEDVADPRQLSRIADSCRRLHAGPRFTNDFNMFRVQEQYRQLVGERNFQLPNRYDDFTEHVAAMERALAWRPELTVPCNNDLLAGNFVDDGHQVWLIDYEYSGNNDPCFELGNIWSESDLPLPLLDLLIARYYGRPSRRLTARARLLAIMSKYGWTLWASIQQGTSEVDFDFWTWGMEKYDRAVAEFDGADFERLLEEAMTDED